MNVPDEIIAIIISMVGCAHNNIGGSVCAALNHQWYNCSVAYLRSTSSAKAYYDLTYDQVTDMLSVSRSKTNYAAMDVIGEYTDKTLPELVHDEDYIRKQNARTVLRVMYSDKYLISKYNLPCKKKYIGNVPADVVSGQGKLHKLRYGFGGQCDTKIHTRVATMAALARNSALMKLYPMTFVDKGRLFLKACMREDMELVKECVSQSSFTVIRIAISRAISKRRFKTVVALLDYVSHEHIVDAINDVPMLSIISTTQFSGIMVTAVTKCAIDTIRALLLKHNDYWITKNIFNTRGTARENVKPTIATRIEMLEFILNHAYEYFNRGALPLVVVEKCFNHTYSALMDWLESGYKVPCGWIDTTDVIIWQSKDSPEYCDRCSIREYWCRSMLKHLQKYGTDAKVIRMMLMSNMIRKK